MALLEKSYEIAARYMNGGQAPEAPRQKASVSGKASVQPVRQVRRNIVSLLAAPLPDSVFAREFVKPRNWGFNTVGSDLREPERNSIRRRRRSKPYDAHRLAGRVTFRSCWNR